ncbi:histidine phosphatase superfamily [Baffinella frigidus]|nr:histidine phosphatase superfamily [Cryptophyta sp. CCMP2293]
MARPGFALLLVALLSGSLVLVETEGDPYSATGFTAGCGRERGAGRTVAFRGCLRITGGGACFPGIPLRQPAPDARSEEPPEESEGVCTLVIVRHGQSIWNMENRFTGWMDVPLAKEGIENAHSAARLLEDAGIEFDVGVTSVLQRAVQTCEVLMGSTGKPGHEIVKLWQLNERHDGALCGLNKKLAVMQYGKAEVQKWRRSYSVRPPPLDETHQCWPGHDPRYTAMGLQKEDLPVSENLADVLARVMPVWESEVVPHLKAGKTVLVATHGNVVRLLCKLIDHLTEREVCHLDVPQCTPLVYHLRTKDLSPLRSEASWVRPFTSFFFTTLEPCVE